MYHYRWRRLWPALLQGGLQAQEYACQGIRRDLMMSTNQNIGKAASAERGLFRLNWAHRWHSLAVRLGLHTSGRVVCLVQVAHMHLSTDAQISGSQFWRSQSHKSCDKERTSHIPRIAAILEPPNSRSLPAKSNASSRQNQHEQSTMSQQHDEACFQREDPNLPDPCISQTGGLSIVLVDHDDYLPRNDGLKATQVCRSYYPRHHIIPCADCTRSCRMQSRRSPRKPPTLPPQIPPKSRMR